MPRLESAVDGMPDTNTPLGLSGTKPGTSWVAVGGGVLATMGVAALLTPILTAYLATSGVDLARAGSAVPVLIALAIAALAGGYTAGRIAKRRTGWHGLLSGLLGLLVTGSYLLASVAVQGSFLGIDDRALPDFFPMVLTLGQYHSEPALTLGFIGFPAQILAAWIGGLLARPRSAVGITSPRIVVATPPTPPQPSAGGPRGALTPL